MKDLPWMFVIALIIWLIVAIFFWKKFFTKDKPAFLKNNKNLVLIVLAAISLTATDIWYFVEYIPTHFRKHNTTEQQVLSTNDVLKDLQPVDSMPKTTATVKAKDTAAKKVAEMKPAAKIYSTNKAKIRFFSSTPAEDIEATNANTVSALNDKTGDLRFIALIKSFHFENELMQDHFNSADYMNSDAFPKSEFKGTIVNIQKLDLTKDGVYTINANGTLSIHGITKKISVPGTITVSNGKISVKSVFRIKRMDYGITTDEIADTLEITVTAQYD
jgi:polyisoprenoid-binding protein YceI